ncbi:type II secretion system protein [Loigolactobacillus binensis]|uniref:Type II secretion system protein n=1 Tax=Loigolactobacillus binensis TaxID=2559922 RepID=A0ABW3EE36_9LACO|nr:type II secretion system protein [Loigolactobacillus binensis]
MNKRPAFILAESICALTVIVLGLYTFNTTFQQFILKLQQQRQATDQTQVLWVAAQHHAQDKPLTQLKVNGRTYPVQIKAKQIDIGQGAAHVEITW